MRKLTIIELDRKTVPEFKANPKLPVVVVLDNIRSANNVGSFFRTSDAFLIKKIYLCGITATPPNNEIRKTALGATQSVEWEHHETTTGAIQKLKSDEYTIVSVEQVENSHSLSNFTPLPQKNYAFVFGNEVKGVEQAVVNQSDVCIEIPQYGTKHSLNVSVSGGIVLWDIFCKLGENKITGK